MNQTELYEIVKDHRDVWGKHFGTYHDREYEGSTEFVRRESTDATNTIYVAAELLGLGVAWLVGNLGDTIIGKPNHGGYGVRDTWMVPRVHTRGGSLLDAVYAAIAEMKAKA